jgi:serine/threonine protein kinase
MYLAFELCDGNLETAVRDNYMDFIQYFTLPGESSNFFLQLSQAIKFLHKNNITQWKIRPETILWKKRGDDQVVFIISDFHSNSNNAGWNAPELKTKYRIKQEMKSAVHIFSLGCVFYFVLTKAEKHLFGNITDLERCQTNIFSKTPVCKFEGLDVVNERYNCKDLVEKMVISDPKKRIKAKNIEYHPFFWTLEQKAKFFHTVGNWAGDKNDYPHAKTKLEERKETVFNTTSWMKNLPKEVQKDLEGFKNESTNLCCLLKVVRNKIEHFKNIKDAELQRTYGNSSEGVVEFYTNTFPMLLIYTYNTLINENVLRNEKGVFKI